MVNLYKLSSEQLSKQDHYDFGMRAVKSVLVMAGSLRRKDPSVEENIVLIRAMRDSNVPKFLEHDLPLFEGIVNDLFPGIVVPFIDYGKLQEAIENQLRKVKYQVPPKYIKKVIQLLETMIVRHGVMLVGLTGTGKSTCNKILAKALTQLANDGISDPWYKSVHIDTLNPKAVTMGELFGETNIFTMEWTEGLVSKLFKDAVAALESDKPDAKRWINFDGPVDALWIENMNTVLDDNKMLCLPNG
jgi:dynein heavy chain, axonemal